MTTSRPEIHSSVTKTRVYRAFARDDHTGFCRACGFEQGGCEPDATDNECESCGERQVTGAEQLVITGVRI